MAFLVANIPPVKCFVRREYLYNHESGQGELEPCVWMTAKAIKGQAFRIESMLTNYGALYDKLPISAYVWKTVDDPLPLDHLQIWDCLSYDMAVIEKSNLRGLKVKFYGNPHFGKKCNGRCQHGSLLGAIYKRLGRAQHNAIQGCCT